MSTAKKQNNDSRVNQWESAVEQSKQRKDVFETMGGLELDPMYLPDNPDAEYFEDLGMPGQYPPQTNRPRMAKDGPETYQSH